MLPKQARVTFRKHITKPSEQVAAPPSSKVATKYPLQTADQRREKAMRRKCRLEAENPEKVLLGELYEDKE